MAGLLGKGRGLTVDTLEESANLPVPGMAAQPLVLPGRTASLVPGNKIKSQAQNILTGHLQPASMSADHLGSKDVVNSNKFGNSQNVPDRGGMKCHDDSPKRPGPNQGPHPGPHPGPSPESLAYQQMVNRQSPSSGETNEYNVKSKHNPKQSQKKGGHHGKTVHHGKQGDKHKPRHSPTENPPQRKPYVPVLQQYNQQYAQSVELQQHRLQQTPQDNLQLRDAQQDELLQRQALQENQVQLLQLRQKQQQLDLFQPQNKHQQQQKQQTLRQLMEEQIRLQQLQMHFLEEHQQREQHNRTEEQYLAKKQVSDFYQSQATSTEQVPHQYSGRGKRLQELSDRAQDHGRPGQQPAKKLSYQGMGLGQSGYMAQEEMGRGVAPGQEDYSPEGGRMYPQDRIHRDQQGESIHYPQPTILSPTLAAAMQSTTIRNHPSTERLGTSDIDLPPGIPTHIPPPPLPAVLPTADNMTPLDYLSLGGGYSIPAEDMGIHHGTPKNKYPTKASAESMYHNKKGTPKSGQQLQAQNKGQQLAHKGPINVVKSNKKQSPLATGSPPPKASLSTEEQKNEYEWQKFKIIRKVKKTLDALKEGEEEETAKLIISTMQEESQRLAKYPGPKEQYVALSEIVHTAIESCKTETHKMMVSLLCLMYKLHPDNFCTDLKKAVLDKEQQYVKVSPATNASKLYDSLVSFLLELYGMAGRAHAPDQEQFKVMFTKFVFSVATKWITFDAEDLDLAQVYSYCLMAFFRVLGPELDEKTNNKFYVTIRESQLKASNRSIREGLLDLLLFQNTGWKTEPTKPEKSPDVTEVVPTDTEGEQKSAIGAEGEKLDCEQGESEEDRDSPQKQTKNEDIEKAETSERSTGVQSSVGKQTEGKETNCQSINSKMPQSVTNEGSAQTQSIEIKLETTNGPGGGVCNNSNVTIPKSHSQRGSFEPDVTSTGGEFARFRSQGPVSPPLFGHSVNTQGAQQGLYNPMELSYSRVSHAQMERLLTPPLSDSFSSTQAQIPTFMGDLPTQASQSSSLSTTQSKLFHGASMQASSVREPMPNVPSLLTGWPASQSQMLNVPSSLITGPGSQLQMPHVPPLLTGGPVAARSQTSNIPSHLIRGPVSQSQMPNVPPPLTGGPVATLSQPSNRTSPLIRGPVSQAQMPNVPSPLTGGPVATLSQISNVPSPLISSPVSQSQMPNVPSQLTGGPVAALSQISNVPSPLIRGPVSQALMPNTTSSFIGGLSTWSQMPNVQSSFIRGPVATQSHVPNVLSSLIRGPVPQSQLPSQLLRLVATQSQVPIAPPLMTGTPVATGSQTSNIPSHLIREPVAQSQMPNVPSPLTGGPVATLSQPSNRTSPLIRGPVSQAQMPNVPSSFIGGPSTWSQMPDVQSPLIRGPIATQLQVLNVPPHMTTATVTPSQVPNELSSLIRDPVSHSLMPNVQSPLIRGPIAAYSQVPNVPPPIRARPVTQQQVPNVQPLIRGPVSQSQMSEVPSPLREPVAAHSQIPKVSPPMTAGPVTPSQVLDVPSPLIRAPTVVSQMPNVSSALVEGPVATQSRLPIVPSSLIGEPVVIRSQMPHVSSPLIGGPSAQSQYQYDTEASIKVAHSAFVPLSSIDAHPGMPSFQMNPNASTFEPHLCSSDALDPVAKDNLQDAFQGAGADKVMDSPSSGTSVGDAALQGQVHQITDLCQPGSIFGEMTAMSGVTSSRYPVVNNQEDNFRQGSMATGEEEEDMPELDDYFSCSSAEPGETADARRSSTPQGTVSSGYRESENSSSDTESDGSLSPNKQRELEIKALIEMGQSKDEPKQHSWNANENSVLNANTVSNAKPPLLTEVFLKRAECDDAAGRSLESRSKPYDSTNSVQTGKHTEELNTKSGYSALTGSANEPSIANIRQHNKLMSPEQFQRGRISRVKNAVSNKSAPKATSNNNGASPVTPRDLGSVGAPPQSTNNTHLVFGRNSTSPQYTSSSNASQMADRCQAGGDRLQQALNEACGNA